MGQTINSYLKEMEEPENSSKDETIEQLRQIQQMFVTRIETGTSKMKGAATADKHFPLKAVVRTVEKQLIATERTSLQEIKICVSEACRTEFLDGLIMVVWEDVNELLQNEAEGVAERMACHVVVANSSVLRLDYCLYKCTFSSKGSRDNFKNAVCYVVQVGIMDLEKADLDVVKQEFEKNVTNIDELKFHHQVILMIDLFREITRLQIAFGGEENNANYAWQNTVRYLLTDFHDRNRQTFTKAGLKGPGKIQKVKETSAAGLDLMPRNSSSFFPLTALQPNPNLSAAAQLTERPEKAPVPSFGTVEERKQRKKKEKLRRQKERDKKANWEGEH